MTLYNFLKENNLKLTKIQKLQLGKQIKDLYLSQGKRKKKVKSVEDDGEYWVINYEEGWLEENAPDIIIEFVKNIKQ